MNEHIKLLSEDIKKKKVILFLQFSEIFQDFGFFDHFLHFIFFIFEVFLWTFFLKIFF